MSFTRATPYRNLVHILSRLLGSRGGALVIVLAAHKCVSGSILVRCHMWVEFVVSSHAPCFEGFSPCTPVFLHLKKPTERAVNHLTACLQVLLYNLMFFFVLPGGNTFLTVKVRVDFLDKLMKRLAFHRNELKTVQFLLVTLSVFPGSITLAFTVKLSKAYPSILH